MQEYEELFQHNFPFWSHLTPSQQQLLNDHTTSMHYAKGAFIHGPNQECTGILLVKHGQLRTYLLSEEGREVTLYRLFAKDVCILSASCVLESITFDVFIQAEEDSDVLVIPSAIFHQLANANIYVKCFGYERATARFSDVMWTMQQVLFMGADKRLAIFLWDEMMQTKKDRIELTHEQIARYMGSAREVVTRMLKYFASEGIVQLSRGTIQILDKEKLHRLL